MSTALSGVRADAARLEEGASRASISSGPVLTLKEPDGVARSRWPVSAGVPLPRGWVRDFRQLRLVDGDKPTALQSRVLSRWSDGSVRWVLLDWQADVEPRELRKLRVERGSNPAPRQGVIVRDSSENIDIDTGAVRFRIPRHRFAIVTDVEVDSVPVTAGPVTSLLDFDGKRIEARAPNVVKVTEAGPLRVRVELRGHYDEGFEYIIRIDAFANQPFVRVLHTFEAHTLQPYTFLKQLSVHVPLQLAPEAKLSWEPEKGKPTTTPLRSANVLLQADNNTVRVNEQARNGKSAGWVHAVDAAHGVGIASRFFWQEYPQSFEVSAAGAHYNLWAPQAEPAKIGSGAAKTHELYLYFHAKTAAPPDVLANLADPLTASIDPQWVARSAALANGITAKGGNESFVRELNAAFQRYLGRAETEQWDDSGEVSCPRPDANPPQRERPRQGLYGMFNWGDWNFAGYHDDTKGCDAWGNLEYDTTQVLALGYAATGDPRYLESMTASARHFMDVDRIHYSRVHPSWVGMNHPKNPLHFAFELGGVDLGHTWTEGILSYYYFTGDDAALEAARGIADFLVQRLRAPVLRGNPRQFGWPQIALVAAYQATNSDAYKNAAVEYARHGMKAHPPEGVNNWKLGILAEALTYTHSVTHDAQIGEWLARYAAALSAYPGSVDARLLPALAYLGRVSGKKEYANLASAAVPKLKFGNWGKPFTLAGRLGFRILSQTAGDAD